MESLWEISDHLFHWKFNLLLQKAEQRLTREPDIWGRRSQPVLRFNCYIFPCNFSLSWNIMVIFCLPLSSPAGIKVYAISSFLAEVGLILGEWKCDDIAEKTEPVFWRTRTGEGSGWDPSEIHGELIHVLQRCSPARCVIPALCVFTCKPTSTVPCFSKTRCLTGVLQFRKDASSW